MSDGRLNYLAPLFSTKACIELAFTGRRMTGKTLWWLALVCGGLTPIVASAQVELDRIAQTWTGLEKFRNQLSVVKLAIEGADAEDP